jgi:GntR family transcriptional regulator
MIIHIDTQSDHPIYKQIVNEIQRLLAEDKISIGILLPPVRQLAADLGVNLNTVAAAYRELETLGFIRIRHGSGAVIVQSVISKDGFEDQLTQQIEDIIVWSKVRGFSVNELNNVFANAINRIYKD